MSKIRDAMRKARGEQPLDEGATPEFTVSDGNSKKGDGPLGLVPSLSPRILTYYESIGKQIEVSLGVSATRNLIFTGAVGGEGLSTVVAQYGEMLSRRGERVLLIDGNPRHPSLHEKFNVPGTPGLAEFISGSAPRDAVVHPTGLAKLSLVPLGRCSDRSQAERVTEVLGEFQAAFVQSYDYVLVDTDFIGSPFFSQSAVASSDGVILVIRSGKTHRQVVGRGCDVVRRIGGQILGVILNRREFPIPDFIYRRL